MTCMAATGMHHGKPIWPSAHLSHWLVTFAGSTAMFGAEVPGAAVVVLVAVGLVEVVVVVVGEVG